MNTRVLVIFLVTLIVACGPSSTQQAKAPIRLGLMYDLTGAVADNVIPALHGAQIAIDEANAAGGVNGHQLETDIVDDASNVSTGIANYHKLVDRDGIRLIIGPDFTPIAVAVAALAEADHVLMYDTSSTAIPLTTPLKNYVFAASATGVANSAATANLLVSMKKTKIGLIMESDAFGQQNTAALNDALSKRGTSISLTTGMDPQAVDATSQIAKMKQAGVDAVVTALTADPTAAVIKAAFQQSFNVPLFAIGGVLIGPVVPLIQGGQTPIEFYATTSFSCPLGIGTCGKDIIAKYVKRFGGPASTAGINPYYPMLAYFAALKRAKSFDPDDVKAALESAPPYESPVLPPIQFSPSNHRGTGQAYLVGYKDGKPYFFGDDINKNTIHQWLPSGA